MSPATSSSQRIDGSGIPLSARCGQGAIACIFGIAFLSAMVWTDGDESYAVSIKAAIPSDLDPDMVIVSLAHLGFSAKRRAEVESPDDAATQSDQSDISPITEDAVESPRPEPPAVSNAWTSEPIALRAGQDMLRAMKIALAGASHDSVELVSYGRDKILPKFFAAYRSVLKQIAVMGLQPIHDNAARTHATIVGTASTYNPHREGNDEGGVQTASGESYDPGAWTAAIRIDLRDRFGGVRYGRLYQPAYALVESGDKRVIVKINDVGPLRPGRVIDLNERSMRYFDPFLERGLLSDAKVTLLPGEDWTPGPVGGFELASLASAQ